MAGAVPLQLVFYYLAGRKAVFWLGLNRMARYLLLNAPSIAAWGYGVTARQSGSARSIKSGV